MNSRIDGHETEIVLGATKGGKAFGLRADNGKRFWTLSVGTHRNDTGPLPRKPIAILPGDLGGVETPMALAENRLFAPWLDLAAHASATGQTGGFNFNAGRGGLTAVSAATGKVLWQHKLPSPNFGAARVANDVIFTSDYAGTIYAFDTTTGKTLWTAKAPAGVNSFPAVDGDTLLVGGRIGVLRDAAVSAHRLLASVAEMHSHDWRTMQLHHRPTHRPQRHDVRGCSSPQQPSRHSRAASFAFHPPATHAAQAKGAVVSTAKTSFGGIIVNSKGRTLTSGKPGVAGGAKASLIGTTMRADGRLQVTYNHRPPYTFVKDTKSGQTNGEGVNAFGAVRNAMSPAGCTGSRATRRNGSLCPSGSCR